MTVTLLQSSSIEALDNTLSDVLVEAQKHFGMAPIRIRFQKKEDSNRVMIVVDKDGATCQKVTK